MNATERAPGLGERNAVLGYAAQYLLAAGLIYDHLLDGRLEWIAVADPEAGRVDDVQIAIPGLLDAYQFKWHEYPPSLTYGELKGGASGGGLVAHLADGWARLCKSNADRTVRVHLFTNSVPSVEALPAAKAAGRSGLPHHLAAFLAEAWGQQEPTTTWGPDADRWRPCLDELRVASALPSNLDFESFRRACVIETGQRLPVAAAPDGVDALSQRHRDIEALARLLFNVVGRERAVIRLTRQELLRRLGWGGRFEFSARHDFPLTRAYQPIDDTVSELEEAVGRHTRGYVALLGTPGSGKSSLLTAAFRYRAGFRIIRYYCFVPNDGGLSRGEAANFLHDLTLALWREGVRPNRMSPSSSLEECRALFGEQLAELHGEYVATGHRTILLVDGLDHIEREQSPHRSLLAELPPPASVPDGVLVLLGSQKLKLDQLSPRIAQQLRDDNRTVRMRPLSPRAVRAVLDGSGLSAPLDAADIQEVVRRSARHPLALAYLVNRLQNARTPAEAKLAIEASPPYADNIEQEYEIYWTHLLGEKEVHDLLALASRLRGTLNLSAAVDWVGERVVHRLVESGRQYFTAHGDGHWSFFHNSFRQFVLDRTGRSPFRDAADPERDHRYHRQLADLTRQAAPGDPFSWEEIYHRFHAGDFATLIAAATQAWFRQQFLDGRPPRLVREDIGWALRAASELNDPLALVRLLLADDEVSARMDVLDDLDLPRLRLTLGDPDGALAATVHDGELLVGHVRALRLAAEFLRAGNPSHARQVFAAAEPLDLLTGSRKVKRWGGQDHELIEAWLDVAHHFLPLADIAVVIKRLDVDERHSERSGEDPALILRRMREAFLVDLADSVLTEGDEDHGRELLDIVGAQHDAAFARALGERMDEVRIAHHPGSPGGGAALDRLLATHAASPLPTNRRLLLAERVLRVRGDAETAARLIDDIDQPASLAWRSSGRLPKTLAPFVHLIRLNRLLAALGRPVEPEIAVPNAADQDKAPDVLLERMIVRVANVWGMAWRGRGSDPAVVWRSLLPALRIQEISRSDRARDPLRWYGYRGVAEDYFNFVVQAAAAHGNAALARFGDEIEARWSDPPTAGLWPPDLKRQIALKLLRLGDAPERLRRTLEGIEPSLGQGEEAHDRLSSFESQIRAWAELGEIHRAQALVPRMLAGSFGIYHDKDTQLDQWVLWFDRALRNVGGQVRPDIATFMSGIASAATARRGYRPSETAEAAIAAVARAYSPAAADVYRRAFLEEGALDFEAGIAAVCSAAVRTPAAVPATCAVVAHLCLPYTELVRTALARDLGRSVGDLEDRALAARFLSYIEDAIDIDLAPDLRAGWREDIAASGRESRHADLFVHIQSSDTVVAGLSPSRSDEHASVTLRDGANLPAAEVRRRGSDKAGLFSLLSNIAESRFYDWLSLVQPLASGLDANEAAQLSAALRRVGARAKDVQPLWMRLQELGRTDLLETDAKAFLDLGERYGWYRHFDGGSRLTPLQTLAGLDERYRALALRTFVADYLGGARNPRDAARSLDELTDLFWAKPPTAEIWREVREHVFQLEEFRAPSARLPSAESKTQDGEAAFVDVLVGIMFQALALPLPEVRDDAYRALISAATESACAAAISKGIGELLDSPGEGLLLGLSLLDGVPEPALKTSGHMRDRITATASSMDAAARSVAMRLLRKLDVQPPPGSPRALPAVYGMKLPPFATDRTPRAAVLLEPGTVLPETSDPLELVGAAQPVLDLVARAGGIPLRNIVERAVSLMHSFGSDEPWDAATERALMARCRAFGFETAYRRPRAAAALRAASIIVGELLEAGALEEDLAAILVPTLVLRDPVLADTRPERRLAGCGLRLFGAKLGPGGYIRPEGWVDAAAETAAFDWPVLCPGDDGEIIGFDFQAHMPDWGQLKEKRRGAYRSPDGGLAQAKQLFEELIPSGLLRPAAAYPKVFGARWSLDESLVVQGLPLRVELGRTRWLAINPLVAADCGWRISPEGLFRWADAEGRTMVESRWWRDGRPGRGPRHDDTRAEGWLVWASPAAAEQFRLRFPGWSRVQAAKRSAVSDERRYIEKYSADPVPPPVAGT